MIVSPHPVYESLRESFLERATDRLGEATENSDWFYPANHDPATESIECLHLILDSESLGTNSLDKVPRRFIKDTDSDGLFRIR